VRWDRLFADLEAQLSEAEAAGRSGEVADRSRGEVARLRLVDRLRPATGQGVGVVTRGGTVHGVLLQVTGSWLLLEEDGGREVLVPVPQVLAVSGLGDRSAEPGSEGAVAARLGLGTALRGLARDRAPVRLVLLGGSDLAGTLDRVGADFVELVEHPGGEPRRRSAVRRAWQVPFAALVMVRAGYSG
jgi:hypothetical protein